MSVTVIPASEVSKLLPMKECIERVESSLLALKSKTGDMPLRFGYRMPLQNERVGILASMPAYMEVNGKSYCSNKVITVYPANKKEGLESHQGAIMLFEAEHGTLLSIVDASSVTSIRTAAASAVATKLLALPESSHLAIVGCGTLAYTHLDAMVEVRPGIKTVSLWNRSPDSVSQFIEKMSKKYSQLSFKGFPTVEEAVHDADIVCTLTASTDPILTKSMIKAGCHINAVGSCTPMHCEVSSDLVMASKIFADATESCLKEPGDIVRPLSEGLITANHIQGELSDVLLKDNVGRSSTADITLFESLGLAIEDLVCSLSIYEKYHLRQSDCTDVVKVNLNPMRH